MKLRHTIVWLIIGITITLLSSQVSRAGWFRFNGKTTLDHSTPTTATIWMRENVTGDLVLLPLKHVQVFENTIHVAVTSGTSRISFGYWQIDSAGDYVPIEIDTSFYTMDRLQSMIQDCEWKVDALGDLIPKD